MKNKKWIMTLGSNGDEWEYSYFTKKEAGYELIALMKKDDNDFYNISYIQSLKDYAGGWGYSLEEAQEIANDMNEF